MNEVLKMLLEGESLSTEQMAKILAREPAAIAADLAKLKADNILLGWRPVLHPNAAGENQVRALIEVKVTPEREGGFDRIAKRIAKFDEVTSLFLMSGGYDLLIFVEGRSLREVAQFVAEKLATLEGVTSTGTHFMLKTYKEQGVMMGSTEEFERLKISP